MRRKRFMKGSVRPRKHGRTRVWVGQWWEEGGRKSRVLGKCSEMTKGQAEAAMAAILQPLNEEAGKRQTPAYTFKEYVEQVYLPICRRKWKESTRMTSEPTIQYHLTPILGLRLMTEINRDEMQELLDGKAETLSTSVVAHLRWHLSGIFKLAVSDGVVPFNPTLGLHTPECKATNEKRYLTKEQILLALSVLDQRERLIFRMAVIDGLRPGEILAIRVGSVGERSVVIRQRVYRGTLDTPKGRKGKRTERTIGLSPGTVAELGNWMKQLPSLDPDRFLFPTENPATTVSRDNLWRRDMRPRLKEVGLEWATFQVLRRTNANLSRKAKIDDKVAADQRGHGLGVSLEVYANSDLEQKIEALEKLESEMIQ